MADFHEFGPVKLTDASMGALLASAARENLTKTDVVNRALRIYDLLTRHADEGDNVYVDNNGTTNVTVEVAWHLPGRHKK